jgi:hypothetical protein
MKLHVFAEYTELRNSSNRFAPVRIHGICEMKLNIMYTENTKNETVSILRIGGIKLCIFAVYAKVP